MISLKIAVGISFDILTSFIENEITLYLRGLKENISTYISCFSVNETRFYINNVSKKLTTAYFSGTFYIFVGKNLKRQKILMSPCERKSF